MNGSGEIAHALAWIAEQAQNGMAIACGCASTHGDEGGGLEMLNSLLSDIAINAELAMNALAAGARSDETTQLAQSEGRQSGLKGNAHD